ncbi:hypothetical protein DUNSADRAFT_12021 [Dunaliella salina]|uniref:Uncharacterized protein n=1 Tax=Dunaliella salina TaxID=3046 RepID=A0ABQ7GC49_DUNSA|nr:hypothetical protein DUNSADRAFT_12021 [Dunaliella salina]|eukprot:KAF5832184.1 hypothetical protein DUNSADRAFT_12021 [Dunaliella salina]
MMQAASNMATLTNSSMATPPAGGVIGPNLLADAQGAGGARRAAAPTNAAADGMGGAARGVGRGAAEGGPGARRRAERAETAAAATAATTAAGTAAAAGGTSGSAQASGSRTSGRKRKPTQLPGAHSPKRDSTQGCAAERQVSQPLVALPPPGANVQLPPISSSAHAAAASGVQQPLGGVVGEQPEVLGLTPAHPQVQMPTQGLGVVGVEAGVLRRPTQSLPDLSPFATPGIMGNLAGHFPCWQQPPQQQGQQHPQQQQQPQQQGLQGTQQPLNGPAPMKPQQQDSFVAMLPSGLGGASSSGLPSLPHAANGAAHLLPVHTGGPAGQAGEQAAQPGVAAQGGMETGALLLGSNPLANPLMSHLPFTETIGGSFNMPCV